LGRLSRSHRNLVSSELHRVSSAVVKLCKGLGYRLIVKELRGLRDGVNVKVKQFNFRSGKVQPVSRRSRELKRRLNSWWFRKFLDQLGYKAKWRGLEVRAVNPKGSSSPCPTCGSRLKAYLSMRVECRGCGYFGDRHVTACLNLLKSLDVKPRIGLERPRMWP